LKHSLNSYREVTKAEKEPSKIKVKQAVLVLVVTSSTTTFSTVDMYLV